MKKATKHIWEGFHSLTPALVVNGGAAAIEFYKKAFGAQEVSRMPTPDGKIMHAELKIGDSMLMLSDEMPDWGVFAPPAGGKSGVTINIYVEDVDAVWARAVAAGATVVMPLEDMFWGDRYGKVLDPFGHQWSLATHKWDLTPEEIAEAAKKSCGG